MEALSFEDAAAWESWLEASQSLPDGAWVKVRKKNSKQKSITVAEAGDSALCFGWIDSIRKSLDDDFFLQKYSPRNPKGTWSRVNVDRAEALIAAGRMRQAGFAEIEAAKADGRWVAAYESQRNATVPPELTEALKASKPALAAFGKLSKTEQYLAMLPLLKSTTPKTRAARLDKLIADLTQSAAGRPLSP